MSLEKGRFWCWLREETGDVWSSAREPTERISGEYRGEGCETTALFKHKHGTAPDAGQAMLLDNNVREKCCLGCDRVLPYRPVRGRCCDRTYNFTRRNTYAFHARIITSKTLEDQP